MSDFLELTRRRFFADKARKHTLGVADLTGKLFLTEASREITAANTRHTLNELSLMEREWKRLGVEDVSEVVDGITISMPKALFDETAHGYFAKQSGPDYYWMEKMRNGSFILCEAVSLESALRSISNLTYYRMLTLTMPAFEARRYG